MLDDDDGPPLAGARSLGTTSTPQANTSGQTSRTTSHAVHRVRFADLARSRVERHVRRVEHADAVAPESLAIGTRAFDELCRRQRRTGLLRAPAQRRQLRQHGEEKLLIANMLRRVHEPLDVPLDLAHGSVVTCGRIEAARRSASPRRKAPSSALKPRRFANSASASGDRGRPADRRRPMTSAGVGNAATTGMRSNSARTDAPAGVCHAPLLLVNDGTSACSMTRWRGSTSEAISASPNRSSRLQMLRSIGSSQTRPRAIEIAAHERAVDARIDGRRIEGHQSALRIADDADLRACRRGARGSGPRPRAPSGLRSQ